MKSSNNIDKLFADKLSSLESTPSADAWMALEKGLQQRNKKKPVWLPYSVAAAFTILIVSGVLLLNQKSDTHVTVAVTQPEKVDADNKQTRLPEQAEVQPEQKKELAQPQSTNPVQATSPEQVSARKTDKPAAEQKVLKPVESLPAIDKRIREPQQLPSLQHMPQTIARQHTTPTLSQAALTEEPTTIVVTVDLDEPAPMLAEEPGLTEKEITPEKQGKAARLLSKLRKIKKGEFDELGINKENLLAFVKVSTSRPDRQEDDHKLE